MSIKTSFFRHLIIAAAQKGLSQTSAKICAEKEVERTEKLITESLGQLKCRVRTLSTDHSREKHKVFGKLVRPTTKQVSESREL